MRKHFLLVFFLAQLAIGLTASQAAPHLCKDLWRPLIAKGAHRFDFKNDTYESFSKRVPRSTCAKDWTVLIYMAADNDLAPYGLWDLYEMESAYSRPDQAGSTPKMDVIVQWERGPKLGAQRLHMFQSQTPFEIKNIGDFEGSKAYKLKSPVIEQLPALKAGSEEARFKEFLLWGAKRYPSQNLFVIVWGHGQGWTALKPKIKPESRYLTDQDTTMSLPRPKKTEGAPTSRRGRWGGLAFSDGTGGYLSIPSLKRALTAVKQVLKKPIDVYASDACLMQMAEVSTEISETSRFIAGSTQVQSFQGLPYRRVFYEINTGRFGGERAGGGVGARDEAWLISKMLPNLMRASLDPSRGAQGKVDPKSGELLLMSSLSTAEMESRLLPSLEALARALLVYLKENPLRASDLQFVLSEVPAFEGNAQDLRVFTTLLDQLLNEESGGSREGLSPAALRLKLTTQGLRESLLYTIMGYAMGRSYRIDPLTSRMGYLPSALSVFLPTSREEWHSRRSDFIRSRFYKKVPGWADWMDALYP